MGFTQILTVKIKYIHHLIPKKHQQFVLDYFLKSQFKGLLLYHKLGSGKTCSSIMISDQMLDQTKSQQIYVLTPGSLRQGWIEEYCRVCGQDPQQLNELYTFVTYNYNVLPTLPRNFNGSLVIIDEVHNLINGVFNGAKNASGIYDRLMRSNCRILALSGTPIHHRIDEWPLLGNLLKPNTFKLANFVASNFVTQDDGVLVPNDKPKLLKQLSGIISYFPGLGKDYYPEVIYNDPIKVIMTLEQEKKI